MSKVLLENIHKKYGKDPVIHDLSLEIKDKEFLVLVGPSGCGKSTLLRIIAGLEDIQSGEVFLEEDKMTNAHPKDRDVAFVFQNYALYPHMSVYDNIAFGLKMRKTSKAEIEKKVYHAATILSLTDLLKRKPSELSGGQRQRVALGRAIVRSPRVFLMDEPLSNLDAKLRASMRFEIKKLHQKLDTTFIYVTHDQTEAMTMGDRIVVLNNGEIQQVGTAEDIYNNPKNVFVAGFIGSPSMNFIEGEDKILGIRPEDLKLSNNGEIKADVTLIENLGEHKLIYFEIDSNKLIAKVDAHEQIKVGDKIAFTPCKTYFFNKTSKERI